MPAVGAGHNGVQLWQVRARVVSGWQVYISEVARGVLRTYYWLSIRKLR